MYCPGLRWGVLHTVPCSLIECHVQSGLRALNLAPHPDPKRFSARLPTWAWMSSPQGAHSSKAIRTPQLLTAGWAFVFGTPPSPSHHLPPVKGARPPAEWQQILESWWGRWWDVWPLSLSALHIALGCSVCGFSSK